MIIGLSNLDTSNTESMFRMFGENDNITTLDLSTFNTNKVPLEEIHEFVNNNFNFNVNNMIEELNLRRPIYYNTASYGHFGRCDIQLPWEEIKEI